MVRFTFVETNVGTALHIRVERPFDDEECPFIGQFETEIRAERQMDGIKKAKDRGVQFGKRPALTAEQIAELREKRKAGTLIKDLMAEYSLSKATIYRYLSENEA